MSVKDIWCLLCFSPQLFDAEVASHAIPAEAARYVLINHCISILYGLLTMEDFKVAGYFAWLLNESESRSMNSQKKNEANIKSS